MSEREREQQRERESEKECEREREIKGTEQSTIYYTTFIMFPVR